jgi:hypothetical protein
MECLRTCPYDNIALNLRSPGADLEQAGGLSLDEAFKAFIMLGSALVYSAVMLGPWGWLKASAAQIGSLPWLAYGLGLLAFVFVLLPGGFALAVIAGQYSAGRRSLSASPSFSPTFPISGRRCRTPLAGGGTYSAQAARTGGRT